MEQSQYYKRKIVKEELFAESLLENRKLRVFLPPGYDETKQYPVMYCQDGEQFFNFGRIATYATKLILDHDIEPLVIVGIDVILKTRTEDYSPDGERFDAYCRFITEEVIPLVEEKYAVKRDRSGRILAGDSLGGTVSLHLFLDYPDMFGSVLSLSGAFLAPTFSRLDIENDLSGLNIFMLIGTDEQAVDTDRGVFDFLQYNRDLRPLLEERDAVVHYIEKPGKHIWGFWQNELPDALRYFLGK